MVMEVYTDGQEWPIDLPAEPPRERELVARREDGSVAARWHYDAQFAKGGHVWLAKFGAYNGAFNSIVSTCMVRRWTLHSLPPDTPGVPGGTTPREG